MNDLLANSGKAMIEFVESKLTFPNVVLSAENRDEYIKLLAGFRHSRVNANATVAYNIDEIDENSVDGYLKYSAGDLREALKNMNNDEDNLVHTLVEQMKQQVKEYIDFIEKGEFDEDMENNAWLSITLENIAAIFNQANVAAGGKKVTKSKKTKSKKPAKKSKKTKSKKSAKKATKKTTRKH